MLNCNKKSNIYAYFISKGRFWNSFGSAEDFRADTKDCTICRCNNGSSLLILDCQMSDIPLEMNFDHVDMEIHAIDSSDIRVEIKEWVYES